MAEKGRANLVLERSSGSRFALAAGWPPGVRPFLAATPARLKLVGDDGAKGKRRLADGETDSGGKRLDSEDERKGGREGTGLRAGKQVTQRLHRDVVGGRNATGFAQEAYAR